MELAEFKRRFEEGLSNLEYNLDKIRDLLFSEAEVKEDVESYSGYGFKGFCATAKEETSKLQEAAAKIYYYVVEETFSEISECERPVLTPLCADLDRLYDDLDSISYCLGHSFYKLTNERLDAEEINWDTARDSAEFFTNALIKYLDEQIDGSARIIEFIEGTKDAEERSN